MAEKKERKAAKKLEVLGVKHMPCPRLNPQHEKRTKKRKGKKKRMNERKGKYSPRKETLFFTYKLAKPKRLMEYNLVKNV